MCGRYLRSLAALLAIVVASSASFAACPDFAVGRTLATGAGPAAVAIGDLNHDGRSDLAVPNSGANSISILLGNGNGTFAPAVNFAAGVQPSGVAIGDFDGD